MEEIILTGDDLMTSLPSPVVPPELAPRVLAPPLDVCAAELRALFQCLHVNEVEPFCQDHILVYRRCALRRDAEIRSRLIEAELARADGETQDPGHAAAVEGGAASGQDQERGQGGAKAASADGKGHGAGPSKGNGSSIQGGSGTQGSARGMLSAEEGAARVAALRAEVAALQRRLILASSMEGPEGFQVRWRLNGEARDIEARAAALEAHLAQREKLAANSTSTSTSKKWFWLF